MASSIDDTRPTVIFAYTVKGYGLATEGHPQNHSSLLTADQKVKWKELTGETFKGEITRAGRGRRGAAPPA